MCIRETLSDMLSKNEGANPPSTRAAPEFVTFDFNVMKIKSSNNLEFLFSLFIFCILNLYLQVIEHAEFEFDIFRAKKCTFTEINRIFIRLKSRIRKILTQIFFVQESQTKWRCFLQTAVLQL
jgi:hypothetical protein